MIGTYLNFLEEKLLDTEIPSRRYNNLTKEEHDALYSLRDDSTVFIKGVNKGLVVVVWVREDYLKEEHKQLKDREVYEEAPNYPIVLVNTIIKFVCAVICSVILLIILLLRMQNSLGFIFYPKIHKRLHNVPGRTIISNCSLYTENISSFLYYHLQPLAQKTLIIF